MVVLENQPPSSAERLPNTFYIEWGKASLVAGQSGMGALLGLECLISYYTRGTVASMVDRGRMQGQLDGELLGICQPASTEKRDYTAAPSRDMGTKIFWSQPTFSSQGQEPGTSKSEPHQDGRIERRAQLTILFFPEVTWL